MRSRARRRPLSLATWLRRLEAAIADLKACSWEFEFLTDEERSEVADAMSRALVELDKYQRLLEAHMRARGVPIRPRPAATKRRCLPRRTPRAP